MAYRRQQGAHSATRDTSASAASIQAPVTRWEEHPLGPEYHAQWAATACLTTISWYGPHALALACASARCAIVAADATWIVVEEQGVPAVLRERYRLRASDWRALAQAAGYAGPPWQIPDAATWAAVSALIAERDQLRATVATQRRLLRAAHDLLGIETFTPFAQLPSRTELRAAIAALSGDHAADDQEEP